MNTELHKISLRHLIFQRNAFFALSILLAISLVVVTVFLFWKSERIIVVPPTIDKEFWVDSKSISSAYLEQFGYFLGELVLSKSAQSANTQRNILMRHVDPSYSTALNKKLLEEEQNLEKEHASYVFFPVSINSDTNSKEVLLTGDRTTYVLGKAVSTARESYLLSFTYQGSRLLLKGITTRESPK